MLILSRNPRSVRPSGPVCVNRAHPLAFGLQRFWMPTLQRGWWIDLCHPLAHTTTGTPLLKGIPAGGVGLYSNNGANSVDMAAAQTIADADPYSIRLVFTAVTWPGTYTALIDDSPRFLDTFVDTTGAISFDGKMFNLGSITLTTGLRWDLVGTKDTHNFPTITYRTFVNGQFTGNPSGAQAGTPTVVLGRNVSGGGSNPDVIYESWQIWNRALTAEEVMNMYDPATRYDLIRPVSRQLWLNTVAVAGGKPWIYYAMQRGQAA